MSVWDSKNIDRTGLPEIDQEALKEISKELNKILLGTPLTINPKHPCVLDSISCPCKKCNIWG